VVVHLHPLLQKYSEGRRVVHLRIRFEHALAVFFSGSDVSAVVHEHSVTKIHRGKCMSIVLQKYIEGSA
jgi:hypothetical protein